MSIQTNPEDNRKKLHAGHWLLLFMVLSLAVFLVERNASDFMASVITTKQAAPFDGTTMPVQKVPKWTALSADQYKAPYDKIPLDKLIPLPKYDPLVLKTPTESLGWKSDNDLAIRNAKITYSTAYMGDYKLDGLEYVGSHPAVDIKVPEGTPVYAIANGVASQVVDQTTGYGKHIVIRHDNVPSLSDPSAKITLYSSYNHLSELDVAEGDIVVKGQLIGKSGHTGTATTPHVHFQIDTDSAPWHPYWPFTYQEASAAGYSFFDAVNAGLNADKAKAVTISPMLYVQNYLNYSAAAGANTASSASNTGSATSTTTAVSPSAAVNTQSVTDVPPVTSNTANNNQQINNNTQQAALPDTSTTATPAATQATENSTNSIDTPANADASAAVTASKFEFEGDSNFISKVPKTLTLNAVDADGNKVDAYKPKDYVYVKVAVGGATVPDYLSSQDFVNGAATFKVTPIADAGLQLDATDGAISGESKVMQSSMFSDVPDTAVYSQAVSFLKNHGVLTGYPDGTFKPDNVVSRVEALKFILEGSNARLITSSKLPFKDTKSDQWYSQYVATGYSKGIVAGYKDSTFKPSNTVNRAEFLKMLINAMDIRINPIVTRDLYKDVSKDAWYAPYVRYAQEKNVMTATGNYFRPEDGMTRQEVAETIYRMIMLKISGDESYSDGMVVSSTRVDKYFS